jgi:hypothetical protein
MTYKAFVYCWKNKIDGRRYIGSHKGSFDDGYICASKTMLEDYNQNSCLFIRQILMVFDNYDDAINYEKALCRKVDAKNNSKFYNKHNGDGKIYRETYSHEEITKKKISNSTTAFWESEEGQIKKERLQERNRRTSSKVMKCSWQKGLFKNREGPKRARKYKNNIYFGWDDLYNKTGVSIYLYKKYYMNGIDPTSRIGTSGPIPGIK